MSLIPATAAPSWWCYILVGAGGRTYVGATTCLERRLRQHNGGLAGGARATRRHRPWALCCTMGPLTKRAALQLEWRLHRRARGGPRGTTPLERRRAQVDAAFSMERWTSRAPRVADLVVWVVWHGQHHGAVTAGQPPTGADTDPMLSRPSAERGNRLPDGRVLSAGDTVRCYSAFPLEDAAVEHKSAATSATGQVSHKGATTRPTPSLRDSAGV